MFPHVLDRVAKGVSDWRTASLAPLDFPLFRALWFAAMASNLGAIMQMTAASWVMTSLDPSPHIVALVQTAALAPIMILALPAGALADNSDRRTLMLISQTCGLITAVALAFLAYSHMLTPSLLLLCTALVGSAQAMHTPAWQASFADIVPRPALPAAIGLNSLAFNVARSVGPAIGGVVVAVIGAASVFVINALSFLGLITVLAVNKIPRPALTLPPEPVHQAMAAGLRYVWLSPVLKTIFWRVSLFGFGGGAMWSLAPLIANTLLKGSSVDYGLLLGGFGAGALLAAASTAYVRALVGNERLFSICTAGLAIATLGLAFSRILPLSVGLMGIAGTSWIFAFTTTSTCVQMSSPRWVVGRSVALSQVAMSGALALGSAFWGYVAEQAGIVVALGAGAAFMAATLLSGRFAPLPGSEFDDLSPLPQHDVAPPLLRLQKSSGPVIIAIEYQVPIEDAAEFLRLAHELGRMRRRDGARRWSIAQDVDHPEIWVEHVESATWTEHMRRVVRSTVADQVVRDRINAYRTKTVAQRMVERPPGATPLE